MTKEITGFEGLYQITDKGEVIKISSTIVINGKVTKTDSRYLPINYRLKFPSVTLYKDKKNHTRLIHRLVALHFVPNNKPLEKTNVIHRDGNTHNWLPGNLKWVSHAESIKK